MKILLISLICSFLCLLGVSIIYGLEGAVLNGVDFFRSAQSGQNMVYENGKPVRDILTIVKIAAESSLVGFYFLVPGLLYVFPWLFLPCTLYMIGQRDNKNKSSFGIFFHPTLWGSMTAFVIGAECIVIFRKISGAAGLFASIDTYVGCIGLFYLCRRWVPKS